MKKSELIKIIENVTGQKNGAAVIKAIQAAEVKPKDLLKKYPEYLEDDGCHGIVCKSSWRSYQNEVPAELLPFLKEENMGDYTVVVVKPESILNLE